MNTLLNGGPGDQNDPFDIQALLRLVNGEDDPFDLKALRNVVAIDEAFKIGLLHSWWMDIQADDRIHPAQKERFFNNTKEKVLDDFGIK